MKVNEKDEKDEENAREYSRHQYPSGSVEESKFLAFLAGISCERERCLDRISYVRYSFVMVNDPHTIGYIKACDRIKDCVLSLISETESK